MKAGARMKSAVVISVLGAVSGLVAIALSHANAGRPGSTAVMILTDSFEAERAGVVPYPFLQRSRFGVSVQVDSPGGFAHLDQYLKAFGELALPSSTPVRLPDGDWLTIEDVLRESLANFNIDQELEFTAVAYARWLPPTKSWVDRYGVAYTFDELASALLDRRADKTACNGVHTLYAIVNLLRVNAVYKILAPATTRRLEARLAEASRQLEQHQHSTGVWLARWYQSKEPAVDGSFALQAIWVTGHHLEWIALAPQGLRPRRATILLAAHALARLLLEHSYMTAANTYPQFSHACRRLALLEEVKPASLASGGSSAQIRPSE
jgi:hypothetical protein